MKRRIAVITGTRAEYGYLRPLMSAIKAHEDLELLVYATGMHLLKEYGNSIEEIKQDGYKIVAVVDMGLKAMQSEYDMAVSIGQRVIGFADVFRRDKPDIVVVFGDRFEPFAAAIASTAMNIPVAHVAGGEMGFGDLDHVVRHAITKLSHLHIVQTQQSKERVLGIGEEEWRTHNVGSLTLDTILSVEPRPREELSERLDLPRRPYLLLVYHPTSTEWQDAEEQIALVLESSLEVGRERGLDIVVIYPNDYPRGTKIVDVIETFDSDVRVHIFCNLSHLDYISLMSHSSALVGNSSSGIIEAPSLGVPYVCVGTRQKDRSEPRT